VRTFFSLIGADHDHLIYETPSRSDDKKMHTITVDKRDGMVSCTCEDFRLTGGGRAYGDLLDPRGIDTCHHVRIFVATVGKILARGKE